RRTGPIEGGGIARHRSAVERDRESGGRGAAVAVAHRIGESVLQVATARGTVDRRSVVGDVAIRTVGVQRQVTIGTSKRRSDGAGAAGGVAYSGNRQPVAIGIAGV